VSLNTTDFGRIIYTDPNADKPVLELVTHQCVHCGGHFVSKPKRLITEMLTTAEAKQREDQGRKVRGWCMNCNGPVCGPSCAACVPVEQYLENMEKGRDPTFRPVVVSVPKIG